MGAVTDVYLRTRKVPDFAWNTYIARPLAAFVVHWLRHSRVTPHQVTLASLVLALLSATLLVALPSHLGLVLAVLVFQASYVLDCADGMLARLRRVQSQEGHLLDFLIDEVKAFILVSAAAVRLYLEQRQALWLLVGLVGLLGLSIGIAITTFQRRPEIVGVADAPVSTTQGDRWFMRVLRLLVHYPSYILYAALLGYLELYLVPYVVVNLLYAAYAVTGVTLKYARG